MFCFNKVKAFKGRVLNGVHLKTREKLLNCGDDWWWFKSEVMKSFTTSDKFKKKHHCSFNITTIQNSILKVLILWNKDVRQLSLLCTTIVPCVCGFQLGLTGCGSQVNNCHWKKDASTRSRILHWPFLMMHIVIWKKRWKINWLCHLNDQFNNYNK